jgi:multidrug efflux pump subunit AcrA (membrane-fusion protein)
VRAFIPLTLALCLLGACDRRPPAAATDTHTDAPAAPTNRVEIPAAVRRNLGITFAKVEYRNVARTMRLPGRFELLPTARREYRAPLPGRVEVLVAQFQRVEVGTPLYRVESAAWRDLHEQIVATQARVNSMGPLREAHRVHEQSLADKVALWQDRLAQLDELRAAGGGSAAQLTEARATLNATRAELADVMEKDAELLADQQQAEAQLRALHARADFLSRAANSPAGAVPPGPADPFTVHAVAPGVVESLAITPGGLAEENTLALTILQPELLRFHARALQSDMTSLRDALPASVTAPSHGAAPLTGSLRIGPVANPDERTVDLFLDAATIPPWALPGLATHLEVTLEGGQRELSIPVQCVVRDGLSPIIFRRDPANPDRAVRMEADLGVSDGASIVIASGVKEGDEIVLTGNYQLMLATSGSATKAGHFHSDGTFHEGED